MREPIHEYLLERPSGASVRELVDLIFTQPGSDPEIGQRFLASLLGGDDRFTFDSEQKRWRSSSHRRLAQQLDEATFVVVDLETTGGGPGRGDSIIEIGAVKLSGGQIVDTFQSLIDPGRPLPRFITQLTGINDQMLAGQPDIRAVLPTFAEFAGEHVLVAHNARFDRSFLDAAWREVIGRPVTRNFLCTLQLARRLLPALRKRSLDALAGHYGIANVDRHRALGDARITAEVLFQLLDVLRLRGILDVAAVLDFQGMASDGRRFFCVLPRSAVAALPRAPGIYRFSGENGELLYIGKAVNLQQRVSSYLANSRGHSRKTLELIRRIRSVAIEETGSELEASLLEAEQIRHHKPHFNVLRKHLPRIAYLKLTVADHHPRLSIATRPSGSRARYFGPFRGRPHAQRALDTMTRAFQLRTCAGALSQAVDVSPCLQGQIGNCTRPCNESVDEAGYATQVAAFLRFFDSGTEDLFAVLAQRRDSLSEQMRFEAASRVQQDIDVARHLRVRHQQLSWIVEQQHFAVLQRSRDPDVQLLYVVVHGRLVERGRVDRFTDLTALVERVSRYMEVRRPGGIAPEEVDGTTILAAWLRDREASDGYVIPLGEPIHHMPSLSTATAVPEVGEGNCDASTNATERLPEWAAALRALFPPDANRGAARQLASPQ